MSATPQLSYQLNPTPEPLMASPANPATAGYNQSVLTLTASNATTGDVTLTYLRLDLPLGSGATDLLDLADWQTAVGVTPDSAWTLFQTSVRTDASGQRWASYLFHPQDGAGTLPVNNSWTFTWQGVAPTYWGVPINTVAGGPVACLLTEGSPARPDGPASQTLFLEKAPAGWFAPTLVATPEVVDSGGTVQLSWNGPAGASYQLNGLAPGAPDPLPNVGTWASAPLTQAPVAVFTLRVDYTPSQDQPQHAAPQQTVTVRPLVPASPIIHSFTGTVTRYGGQLRLLLSWDVEPATVTVAVSGNPNQLNARGELRLMPSATQPLLTTYSLMATNPAGQQVTASLRASYQTVQNPAAAWAPMGISLTPDGGQAWILNQNSNMVTVLDTATYQIVQTIDTNNSPLALVFTTDGSQAWVLCTGSIGGLLVLDTATYLPVQTLYVPTSLGSIALMPDGGQAWTTDKMCNALRVVDAASNEQYIHVGNGPLGIVITPDGSQAWVAISGDNTVTVWDTATYQPVTSPIEVGSEPWAIALTPDGGQAWVTNKGANTVTVLDTTTYKSVQAAVGKQPQGIALTPDGSQAWVVNGGDNTVTVLDTATYQRVQLLDVGNNWPWPWLNLHGIAFTPDGGQAWVVNTGDNTVTVLAVTAYEPVLTA